jgi:hypothetical protein
MDEGLEVEPTSSPTVRWEADPRVGLGSELPGNGRLASRCGESLQGVDTTTDFGRSRQLLPYGSPSRERLDTELARCAAKTGVKNHRMHA